MRTFYLLNKLITSLSTEGLKETLKEMVYFNRIMVVIEKNIKMEHSIKDKNMDTIIVNAANYREYQKKYRINLHFCKHGSSGLLLCRYNELMGYQFWTFNNNLSVLNQLGISLVKGEAYLYDLYVYPRFRGTVVPRILSVETFNYLVSHGIDKIYGFYFKDNVKALWWHKAYLKCKELRQVAISQFFIFEISGGKLHIGI